jgi:hypothetical protein
MERILNGHAGNNAAIMKTFKNQFGKTGFNHFLLREVSEMKTATIGMA